MVNDLWPGNNSSSPRYLANSNGRLFYAAASSTTGIEPWAMLPPAVVFASPGETVEEVVGNYVVTVQIPNPAAAAITVQLILGGTASLNADYSISATSLLIPQAQPPLQLQSRCLRTT